MKILNTFCVNLFWLKKHVLWNKKNLSRIHTPIIATFEIPFSGSGDLKTDYTLWKLNKNCVCDQYTTFSIVFISEVVIRWDDNCFRTLVVQVQLRFMFKANSPALIGRHRVTKTNRIRLVVNSIHEADWLSSLTRLYGTAQHSAARMSPWGSTIESARPLPSTRHTIHKSVPQLKESLRPLPLDLV